MKKDPNIFLRHIQECITAIESHTNDISEKAFFKDVKTQDAVIRRIEIIGEATKNLPVEFMKKHPEVEWREVARMRDKLIHNYFGVNLGIVWETAKKDIPQLKKQIIKLLKQ